MDRNLRPRPLTPIDRLQVDRNAIATPSRGRFGCNPDQIYKVWYIINEREGLGGGREYFVRWEGYGPQSNSWEPVTCFLGGADNTAVKEWEAKKNVTSLDVEEFVKRLSAMVCWLLMCVRTKACLS